MARYANHSQQSEKKKRKHEIFNVISFVFMWLMRPQCIFVRFSFNISCFCHGKPRRLEGARGIFSFVIFFIDGCSTFLAMLAPLGLGFSDFEPKQNPLWPSCHVQPGLHCMRHQIKFLWYIFLLGHILMNRLHKAYSRYHVWAAWIIFLFPCR